MLSTVLRAVLVITTALSFAPRIAIGGEAAKDPVMQEEMNLANLEQSIVRSYESGLVFDLEEACRDQYLYSHSMLMAVTKSVMSVTDVVEARGVVRMAVPPDHKKQGNFVIITFTMTDYKSPTAPYTGSLPASATVTLQAEERGSWRVISEGEKTETGNKGILRRMAVEAAGLCLPPLPKGVVDTGSSRPLRWSASVPYKEGPQEFISEPRRGGCYIVGMGPGFVDGGDIHSALLIAGTVMVANRQQFESSHANLFQRNSGVIRCVTVKEKK